MKTLSFLRTSPDDTTWASLAIFLQNTLSSSGSLALSGQDSGPPEEAYSYSWATVPFFLLLLTAYNTELQKSVLSQALHIQIKVFLESSLCIWTDNVIAAS
jgi:hypothetical protein